MHLLWLAKVFISKPEFQGKSVMNNHFFSLGILVPVFLPKLLSPQFSIKKQKQNPINKTNRSSPFLPTLGPHGSFKQPSLLEDTKSPSGRIQNVFNCLLHKTAFWEDLQDQGNLVKPSLQTETVLSLLKDSNSKGSFPWSGQPIICSLPSETPSVAQIPKGILMMRWSGSLFCKVSEHSVLGITHNGWLSPLHPSWEHTELSGCWEEKMGYMLWTCCLTQQRYGSISILQLSLNGINCYCCFCWTWFSMFPWGPRHKYCWCCSFIHAQHSN